jgi:hypothetical protein
MRAFETSGVALVLLLVPICGWLMGRFGGRRDWSIGTMLAVAVGLVLAVQCAVVCGQTLIELRSSIIAERGFIFLLERRWYEVLAGLEFPIFAVILGILMTMLGWSSTPARPLRDTLIEKS